MTELEKLCEQALYEEIRDLGDGKSIVRDVPTGRLFYRKELAVYNLQVFSWLKDHKNRSVPICWDEADCFAGPPGLTRLLRHALLKAFIAGIRRRF